VTDCHKTWYERYAIKVIISNIFFVMRVSDLENMARNLDTEIIPKLVLCDFMP